MSSFGGSVVVARERRVRRMEVVVVVVVVKWDLSCWRLGAGGGMTLVLVCGDVLLESCEDV